MTLVTFDSVRATKLRADSVQQIQKITGGAANFTMFCGTGNSRTCTFFTTNGSGTQLTALALNADQSIGVGTNLNFVTGGAINSNSGSMSITGGAGNMSILSGSGASRSMTLQTTNGSSSLVNTMVLGGDSTVTFKGIPLPAVDNVTILGSVSRHWSRVYADSLTGGAGNMLLLAGTGNSRTMTLQTTTSAGAPKNTLVLGADSSATFLGTIVHTRDSIPSGKTMVFVGNGDTISVLNNPLLLKGTLSPASNATYNLGDALHIWNTISSGGFYANNGSAGSPGFVFQTAPKNGVFLAGNATKDTVWVSADGIASIGIDSTNILLPVLPSEGSTKNAMCWDGTTHVVTQNAAATCTVSSIRYKKDTLPVPVATTTSIISNLHANQYVEKEGGRKAFGIIAELADKVDSRLASRDAKGLINSTNYEEVTSLLVDKVNDQQTQISSLSKQVAAFKSEQSAIDSLRVQLIQQQKATDHLSSALAAFLKKDDGPGTLNITLPPTIHTDTSSLVSRNRPFHPDSLHFAPTMGGTTPADFTSEYLRGVSLQSRKPE